jgi:hypothetical protein
MVLTANLWDLLMAKDPHRINILHPDSIHLSHTLLLDAHRMGSNRARLRAKDTLKLLREKIQM